MKNSIFNMDIEGITLEEWMMQRLLVPVSRAKKYKLFQKLTKEQAKEIIELISESTEFDLCSKEMRAYLDYGYPYRDFLSGCITLLFDIDKEDSHGWRKMLWGALRYEDKVMIQRYCAIVFNYDIRRLGCTL